MFRSTVLAFAMLALGAETGWAGGDLVSPTLWTTNGTVFNCTVVNTGTKDLVVDVQVFSSAGVSLGLTEVGAQQCSSLGPGEACAKFANAVQDDTRYCKVTGGSKKTVRASFCDLTNHTCVPLQ